MIIFSSLAAEIGDKFTARVVLASFAIVSRSHVSAASHSRVAENSKVIESTTADGVDGLGVRMF